MPFLSTAVMPCMASGARSCANLRLAILRMFSRSSAESLSRASDQVVGDFRVDVLERIARLERGVGLVRAEVDQAAVTLVLDPHAARGIDGADVDGHEAAVRIDHFAGDDDVDEICAVRDDAHRAPLRGLFERGAQQRRHVARLGLAQIRIDALLGERFVVAFEILGNARVEYANADVEQFGLRDVHRGLLGRDLRDWLDLGGDAAREQHRDCQYCRCK